MPPTGDFTATSPDQAHLRQLSQQQRPCRSQGQLQLPAILGNPTLYQLSP